MEKEYAHAKLYERRGLGLTVFSPLANGFLTGKYVDGVPEDSRLKQTDDPYIKSLAENVGSEAWNKQQDVIRELIKIAERLGTDVATLSMAWVIKNKNVSSAITGASRPEQIWQTVRAVKVQEQLTDEVLEQIEKVVGNKPDELL